MLSERRMAEEAPMEGIPGAAAAPRPAAGEYRCSACGYGAILRPALPLCPMCGASAWEHAARARPATAFAD